ncbi:MAG: CNNM domain-containing protein [Phycisphaerales bacterium]|jgi:CBS domain containing-hemolysin-like protein|nr:CNNM domain-containing protein [Phycisphaerales bacterium]
MTAESTILLIGLAMVATVLFSGMETGLYTLNRVRLQLRADRGDRHALTLRSLLERPHRLLAVVLIGNNAANQTAAWAIAHGLHAAGFGPIQSIVIDTLILVPVLLIFAEILPKDLFRAHGDRWCYALALPLKIIERALTAMGLALFVEWFGRSMATLAGGTAERELTARQYMSDLFKEGIDAGVLSVGQTALLDRAMELRNRRIADVMIPWSKVGTLLDTDEGRQQAIDSRWTRLPVLGRDGVVRGIVSVLDLAEAPDRNLTEVLVEAMTVRPSDRADAALRSLRSHRAAMAIVLGSRDEPVGIVTVKDLIQPLLG